MTSTAEKIAALSKWIDASPGYEGLGDELHARRRVDKIMEEAGEAGQALGGYFGENPRKGVTHSLDDLLGELLDVAITALGAFESLTGNGGKSGEALDAKIGSVCARVGVGPESNLWGIRKVGDPWSLMCASTWNESDARVAAEHNSKRWGPWEVVAPIPTSVDSVPISAPES